MEVLVFTRRACLKVLLRQPQRSLAVNFPRLSQSTAPTLFTKRQPWSLNPLTLQTTSLNPSPLGSGSDTSKLELAMLVTISTQNLFKPNHQPNQRNRN